MQAPDLPVSLLWSESLAERFGADGQAERAASLGLSGVSPRSAGGTVKTVGRAPRRGVTVATWTVDEWADIDRVEQAGVDAICGNWPAAIRQQIDG